MQYLSVCHFSHQLTYLHLMHLNQNAQSIASTIVNFLSALSLINNGVREILPFVRYISQFIDVEFNSIKRQDRGQGVVCAATWCVPTSLSPHDSSFEQITRIMPAAMVTSVRINIDQPPYSSSCLIGSPSLGFPRTSACCSRPSEQRHGSASGGGPTNR